MKMKTKHIVFLLLLLLFIQGFTSAIVKSRTTDEPGHIENGYIYLTTGKWVGGLNNPPLTSIFAAIPFLFVDIENPVEYFERTRQEDYILERKEPIRRDLLMVSRMVPLLFMTALGYVIYLWARLLYGINAGLLALLLYAFSPNILAFGRLVTADIGGALFMVASMYTFWKFIKNPTKANLILASVFFGLAQISKLLAIFLIPVFIFYSLLVFFMKPFKIDFFPAINNGKNNEKKKKAFDLCFSLVVISISGLIIINAIYFFDGTFTSLKDYDKEQFGSSTFKKLYENKLLNWMPVPLPKSYVLGHDLAQWQAKDEVRPYFFWGKVDTEFDFYFLKHILIKTPIALFVLLILGFIYNRKLTLSEIYISSFVLFIILMMDLFNRLLIGYRHIIVVYPLAFILAGRIFHKGFPKGKLVRAVILVSAIWYVASSVLIYPHYLAYFNEFIGGPKNGYKYTIDSNLDWEQDYELVKKYLKKNPGQEIYVDPGCVAFTGKVLIPASSLQFQKARCYQWIKKDFEPIDYIGYSWLVYDIKGSWEQTEQGLLFTKNG